MCGIALSSRAGDTVTITDLATAAQRQFRHPLLAQSAYPGNVVPQLPIALLPDCSGFLASTSVPNPGGVPTESWYAFGFNGSATLVKVGRYQRLMMLTDGSLVGVDATTVRNLATNATVFSVPVEPGRRSVLMDLSSDGVAFVVSGPTLSLPGGMLTFTPEVYEFFDVGTGTLLVRANAPAGIELAGGVMLHLPRISPDSTHVATVVFTNGRRHVAVTAMDGSVISESSQSMGLYPIGFAFTSFWASPGTILLCEDSPTGRVVSRWDIFSPDPTVLYRGECPVAAG